MLKESLIVSLRHDKHNSQLSGIIRQLGLASWGDREQLLRHQYRQEVGGEAGCLHLHVRRDNLKDCTRTHKSSRASDQHVVASWSMFGASSTQLSANSGVKTCRKAVEICERCGLLIHVCDVDNHLFDRRPLKLHHHLRNMNKRNESQMRVRA